MTFSDLLLAGVALLAVLAVMAAGIGVYAWWEARPMAWRRRRP